MTPGAIYLGVPPASKAMKHKGVCRGSDTDRAWADCYITPCSVHGTWPKAELGTGLPSTEAATVGTTLSIRRKLQGEKEFTNKISRTPPAAHALTTSRDGIG